MEAAAAQWSALQSRNPEAAGLSPGSVRKSIWRKTIFKSFMSLFTVASPAEGGGSDNGSNSNN